MENTKAHSVNYTKLKNRVLWFDGDATVSEQSLIEWALLGKPLNDVFVDQLTPSIERFNKLVTPSKQIKVKTEAGTLNTTWDIPDVYRKMSIVEYIVELLETECEGMSQEDYDAREARVAMELSLFKKMNLLEPIRAIIYIINTLEAKKIVWGVGRGSSVSSYILYLIGVHDVDSVEYELDFTDFLHT